MNRRGASGMEDDKGGVAAAWEEDTAGELQEKRKKNKEEVVLPEDAYADVEVPPWWAQITLRGMFVSAILSLVFSIIVIKLSLTTGVIPSLNISAGLLSFFLIKLWTSFLSRFGLLQTPFTRQENTVIQTCVVASSGLAFSGGFGSYIPGMDSITYKLATDATTTPGDDSLEVKNPSLGWIFGFMFAVSFLGLLAVVPLRKIMIIDYKLTYPSGTATAVLINSFHTPTGAKQAKFYFDFSLLYVGTGMICPHLVNCSMLFGGIISWGLMWPLINNNKGKWFSADLPASSLKSINGYRVFIAIALILGDGLYNFVKIVSVTLRSLYLQHQKNQELPTNREKEGIDELSPSEQRRNTVFMKDSIPFKLAAIGYVALAAVSVVTIPRIFPQMRWYYVFISYCIAPVLGFCNAYGCGLTDWSLASIYGKLGLFIFSAWAGSGGGGVIVGLVSCGVMMVIVSCSADLMQDFKTGYLTLSSPRSMFASQILGTLMGCIIAPLSFWLFWTAFPIGDQNGTYPAPYALVYREMAAIGVEGFSALPEHCLDLCYGFFAFAIVTCLTRDLVPEKVSMFIPIPMAMAIPFYLGVYFVIDMFIGTVVVFVWQRVNRKKANVFIPAVASGLICGDGIWTLPAAILALAKVYPPICMLFASRSQASKLLSQLGG